MTCISWKFIIELLPTHIELWQLLTPPDGIVMYVCIYYMLHTNINLLHSQRVHASVKYFLSNVLLTIAHVIVSVVVNLYLHESFCVLSRVDHTQRTVPGHHKSMHYVVSIYRSNQSQSIRNNSKININISISNKQKILFKTWNDKKKWIN